MHHGLLAFTDGFVVFISWKYIYLRNLTKAFQVSAPLLLLVRQQNFLKLAACKLSLWNFSWQATWKEKFQGRRRGGFDLLNLWPFHQLFIVRLSAGRTGLYWGKEVLWSHISFRQLAAVSWVSGRVPAMNFVGVLYLPHT